jgi:hypothetical protein
MAESMSFDDFKLWKVDVLRKFCQERGLATTSKRKDELVALAYAAYIQNYPVVVTKQQEKSDASRQYSELLILQDGTAIPDPFDLSDGWLSENDSLKFWPPCMVINISEYLIGNGERPLLTRLRNDYKEGGVFMCYLLNNIIMKAYLFAQIYSLQYHLI